MALKRYNDNILESMAGGLLTINQAGEVVVINRKGKEVLGWDNRVIGSDWKRPLKGNDGFKKVIRDTLQTGIELLEEVRKMGMDVKVVMITGCPDDYTETRARELGVIDYLKKPLCATELARIATEV